MKKLLTLCSFALLSLSGSAQTLEPHLGIGAGVGTTGIVIDASLTINDYLGVRGGIDIMPKFKVNKDLNLETEDANKRLSQMTAEINDLNVQLVKSGLQPVDLSQYPNGNLPEKLDLQGKLNNTTGHILFDIHPFATSFRVTIGAYFGKEEVISVYNKEDGFLKPINAYNEAIIYASTQTPSNSTTPQNVRDVVDKYKLSMIGGELGDYFVTPNPADNGDVKAYAKVNAFRPYLGLGFGRSVPKGNVGCQFDLGVQFWGKPDIFVPTYDKATKTYQYEKIDGDNAGDDAGKVLKTISKVSVYPVLNFRVVGRLF
jgi:hypothetical protein